MESKEKETPKKKKLKRWQWIVLIIFWAGVVTPFCGLWVMLNIADNDLPTFEELENPRSNLATVIYSADGQELGKYFSENRTNAKFEDLPPHLIDLLVATEDERYYTHAGVDGEALARVVKGIVLGTTSQGGGSTITQQCAKLLFPRPPLDTWELIVRKFKEWILAARLEKSYTKEEIITMYLNQFDFIHNAVGINSASQVYFNCKPSELRFEQAAMLVGMLKNPSLFNPLRDSTMAITRRNTVLNQLLKNSQEGNPWITQTITQEQCDSLKALPLGIDYQRVDHQEGPAPYFREILRMELKELLNETDVEHRITIYFRENGEVLERNDSLLEHQAYWYGTETPIDLYDCSLNRIIDVTINDHHYVVRYESDESHCASYLEEYKYAKENGDPYDIYRDGLKIFTTIDSRMQAHAEWAVEKHLGGELQWDFFENNEKYWKNAPFSNDLTTEKVDTIVLNALLRSDRGKIMQGELCGYCNRPASFISKINVEGKDHWHCDYCQYDYPVKSWEEMMEAFNKPTKMKVFAWKKPEDQKDGEPFWTEIDTIMSPRDSVFYYKSFLLSGLMSMDPHTGYVKAWVGGPNFKHFKFDHVKQARRQVGSTFKPFVYAAALKDGVSPCEEIVNVQWCFDVPDGPKRTKQWCPKNSDGNYDGLPTSLKYGMANSMNSITAALLKNYSSPQAVIDLAMLMGIPEGRLDPVPALCLGVFDLSVFEMTAANATFANKGMYIEPIIITRIEDKNGNVIADFYPEPKEAMSEDVAYSMLEIMQGVTAGAQDRHHPKAIGTGVRLRWGSRPYGQVKYPVAGKTGTTQNNSDGWFVGLTPDLVTVVWTGAEDRSCRFATTSLGQGANQALPIWGYYMKKVWDDPRLDIATGDFEAPLDYQSIQQLCNEFWDANMPAEETPWGSEID